MLCNETPPTQCVQWRRPGSEAPSVEGLAGPCCLLACFHQPPEVHQIEVNQIGIFETRVEAEPLLSIYSPPTKSAGIPQFLTSSYCKVKKSTQYPVLIFFWWLVVACLFASGKGAALGGAVAYAVLVY